MVLQKTAMESHFGPIHCKTSVHNKINKMAVYATVMCGMIRDHPGMLRSEGLHCVNTNFCIGGERERGCILFRKRKMLCWATLSKVSDSLFPIQGPHGAARRAGLSSMVLGPADSLTLCRETGWARGQWPPCWTAESIVLTHTTETCGHGLLHAHTFR